MNAGSLPKSIPLRAGPIELEFETATMFARNLRIGSHELVRAIYSAIRDERWGTYAQQLEELETEIEIDSFKIAWLASCPVSECLGELTGHRDGRVKFEVRLTALESYCSMRSGICVLHPAKECRGLDCTIKHGDSDHEPARFPDDISPHQPFFNVCGMEHAGPGESRVHIGFDGEVFETEDQRNWTDASFKTYCRPLSAPAPFLVQVGAQMEQSVTVEISHVGASASKPRPDFPTLSVGPASDCRFPKIGTMLGVHSKLSADQVARLRSIGLSHIGVKVNLEKQAELGRVTEASRIGLPIELHLHSYDRPGGHLAHLLETLRGAAIARVLLVSEAPSGAFGRLVDTIHSSLGSPVPVFAVAASNFTELNRCWPDLDKLAGVGFAVNPQVHAFDDVSIMETTEMHTVVTEQAKRRSAGKMVSIAPVTLEPASWAQRFPDQRLRSHFGAAWVMASARSLAIGGADFATFFETHGPRGILSEPDEGPRAVELALGQLSRWQGLNLRWTESDLPAQAQALSVEVGETVETAIFNLTDTPIRAQIKGKKIELSPYEWRLHSEGES